MSILKRERETSQSIVQKVNIIKNNNIIIENNSMHLVKTVEQEL